MGGGGDQSISIDFSFVCQDHHLNTGVILDVVIGCGPGVPVGAGVVDVGNVLESGNLRLALDQLQSETLIRVPCDVTYGRKDLLVMAVPRLCVQNWLDISYSA